MTLGFPNPSRTFDPGREAVGFKGHDGMFEISFFVETTALARASGSRSAAAIASEAEYLAAFDAARGSVLDAARQAYSGPKRPFYMVTAAHFR